MTLRCWFSLPSSGTADDGCGSLTFLGVANLLLRSFVAVLTSMAGSLLTGATSRAGSLASVGARVATQSSEGPVTEILLVLLDLGLGSR